MPKRGLKFQFFIPNIHITVGVVVQGVINAMSHVGTDNMPCAWQHVAKRTCLATCCHAHGMLVKNMLKNHVNMPHEHVGACYMRPPCYKPRNLACIG